MPESHKAEKRRVQKANREAGIGDAAGRIVRVKVSCISRTLRHLHELHVTICFFLCLVLKFASCLIVPFWFSCCQTGCADDGQVHSLRD
jgi:hypothetical protein